MGRSRYKVYDSRYPYFATMTFIHWLPLLSYPEVAQICIDSLKYLQSKKELTLYSWVFMENHLHLIAKAPELSKSLGRMKSHTAHHTLEFLKNQSNERILEELHFGKSFHKHSQNFQVWQEGSHPEQINSREMMIQKVEYIHNNPVKRGYVDSAEQWRYSSARDYCDRVGLVPVCSQW